MGADRDGPLDREGADTAARAVDQHGLTLPDSGDHGEVGVDGGGHLRDRGRFDHVDTLGDWHHLGRGHGDFVGVAAAVEQRAHIISR